MNTTVADPPCENCHKRLELCVCADIKQQSPRTRVVILQHPQEPDKDLGSARIAQLALKGADLRVGLSWPNLKKAIDGKAAAPSADVPRNDRWAVLYLGSGIKQASKPAPGLHFVTKTGAPVPTRPEQVGKALPPLDGLIVLDGTWSQAKTLWWRNAWLLKLRRAILVPKQPSLYKELRREPRRECLSTIETIAEALDGLGENPAVSAELRRTFARLLERQRERLASRRKRAPQPASTS